jgi:hypothetical protein
MRGRAAAGAPGDLLPRSSQPTRRDATHHVRLLARRAATRLVVESASIRLASGARVGHRQVASSIARWALSAS